MTVYAGQHGPETLTDTTGRPAPSAQVQLFLPGTTTPATLYSSRDRSVPLAANPVPSGVPVNSPGLDIYGNLLFFADPGRYDLVVTVSGHTLRLTIVVEPDPAEPGTGGGTAGPAGPAGPTPVGLPTAWSAATTYNPLSGLTPAMSVIYNGSWYGALATSTGVIPGTDPTRWALLSTGVSAAVGAQITDLQNRVTRLETATGTAAPPATGIPSAVSSTSTQTGATSVTLSWTAPSLPGSSALTGYTVARDGTDSNGTGPYSTPVAPNVLSLTFLNLLPSTTYHLTVAAKNTAGPGPAVSVAVTTPAASGALPAAPAITATTGSGQATVSWAAVTGATGYQPYLNGTAWGSPVTGLSVTITGLSNGTPYSLTVKALNASGASPASNAVSVTPGGTSIITGDSSTFEGGTLGNWFAGPNWAVAPSTAQAHPPGTHSMLATRNNGTPGSGYASIANVPVSPSTRYTFSAWVQPSAPTAYDLNISSASVTFNPPAGVWTLLTMSYTTLSTETTLSVYIADDPNTAPTAGSSLYIDDVTLTPTSSAPPAGGGGTPSAVQLGIIGNGWAAPAQYETQLGIRIGIVGGYATRDSFPTKLGDPSYFNSGLAGGVASDWVKGDATKNIDWGVPLGQGGWGWVDQTQFAAIAAGNYDSQYRAMFQMLIAQGFPNAYCRIGWEQNGQTTDTTGYINAYRRIVGVMRAAGTGLKAVWCVNAGSPNPESFYPGDAYVDVVASDVYAWYADGTEAATLNKVLNGAGGLNWLASFATAHGKVCALGEWGNGATAAPNLGLGDDPNTVDTFSTWAHNNAAIVKYLNYFDNNAGAGLALANAPQTKARLGVDFK